MDTQLLRNVLILVGGIGGKMAEVKWIKIVADIFDNKKIRIIEAMPEGDTIIVVWFKILMLAGSTNDYGYIYLTKEIPYTDQMLATVFNRPLTTVQLALNTFEQFGMIEIVDNIIHISNWEKYQNVEGLDKIREQTRQRVAKHRERKKIESNVTSNVTVTQSNATDIDIDIDIEKKKNIKKKNFPPTVEEVAEYCKSRGNGIDAQEFIDYYEARSWYSGKTKLTDWERCINTWERRRGFKFEEPKNVNNNNTANKPEMTDEEWEQLVMSDKWDEQ